MRQQSKRRMLFCFGALMLIAPFADAQVPTGAADSWTTAREAEFRVWQAAHSGTDAQVTALKERTKALIAGYRPAPVGKPYADIIAQSARLAPPRKKEASADFAKARTWFQMGDTATAKEYLEIGLAIDPADTTALFERAEIYRRDGDAATDIYQQAGYRANAALLYDKVATLAPKSPEGELSRLALKLLPHVTEAGDVSNPPVLWRVPGAPKQLWDAPYAPKLTILPAGEYTIGGTASEEKYEWTNDDSDNPRHRVRIAYPLAVGTYDVTRAEWAAFIADTHYDTTTIKCTFVNGLPAGGWQDPGFPQTDNDPAVCISYFDGLAYTDWLSRKTGHTYRLLSEAEWEYAARAGTTTAYWWGDNPEQGHANCPGCGSRWDGKSTSPVGSFAPNPFGLYDMTGNAWQVIADCWNYTYAGAPTDGSAYRTGNCGHMEERGSAYSQGPYRLGHRAGRTDPPEIRLNVHTIRVARVL